jgi:hypothetical protein
VWKEQEIPNPYVEMWMWILLFPHIKGIW